MWVYPYGPSDLDDEDNLLSQPFSQSNARYQKRFIFYPSSHISFRDLGSARFCGIAVGTNGIAVYEKLAITQL